MRKIILLIIPFFFILSCKDEDDPIRPQPIWKFELTVCEMKYQEPGQGGMAVFTKTGTAEGKVYVYQDYVEIENGYYTVTPSAEVGAYSEDISGQIALPAAAGVVAYPGGNSIKLLLSRWDRPGDVEGPLELYVLGPKL